MFELYLGFQAMAAVFTHFVLERVELSKKDLAEVPESHYLFLEH